MSQRLKSAVMSRVHLCLLLVQECLQLGHVLNWTAKAVQKPPVCKLDISQSCIQHYESDLPHLQQLPCSKLKKFIMATEIH